jgi:hypothetical protein
LSIGSVLEKPSTHTPDLIETIRASVIGEHEALIGPYGARSITYADRFK